MKTLSRLFFLTLAAMAMGWSTFVSASDEGTGVSSAARCDMDYSLGANLPNTNTVTADTGMPPPLIVVTFVHSDQVGSVPTISMFDTVGQNGHYRDSVATVPPLIHAMSLDKVMDLSSNVISGIDLAGGTLVLDTSQTNDGWSDSGAQSTDISPAVNTDPPEIPAPQSA